MDITIHQSFLPHDDPDASLAFYRDTLGIEVRNDVEYGTFERLRASDGDVVQEPTEQPTGFAIAPSAIPRAQPDPHHRAALSRPAIADIACTDGIARH